MASLRRPADAFATFARLESMSALVNESQHIGLLQLYNIKHPDEMQTSGFGTQNRHGKQMILLAVRTTRCPGLASANTR
jgi:hypothetical protein